MRARLLCGLRRLSQPQCPPQLVVLALQLLLLHLQGGQRLLLAGQLAAANWAMGWKGGLVGVAKPRSGALIIQGQLEQDSGLAISTYSMLQ